MKIIKVIIYGLLSIVGIICILLFEINGLPVGSSLGGLLAGFTLPLAYQSIVDLSDDEDWKTTQRKLLRGKFISKDTIIRLSFAYLYRIKNGNDYFLIKNTRGTEKFQPVGGVYKTTPEEALLLKNKFHAIDDDKIPVDRSSELDYRLRIPSKYLRSFIRRFNSKKSQRERISDVSRELKEELVRTGVVSWKAIRYRYCGRYITNLKYEDHFQCYEIQLFDIIELLPTKEQEQEIENMKSASSNIFSFATAEEIKALGINTDEKQLRETIGSHTQYILQENEHLLMSEKDQGKVFDVALENN